MTVIFAFNHVIIPSGARPRSDFGFISRSDFVFVSRSGFDFYSCSVFDFVSRSLSDFDFFSLSLWSYLRLSFSLWLCLSLSSAFVFCYSFWSWWWVFLQDCEIFHLIGVKGFWVLLGFALWLFSLLPLLILLLILTLLFSSLIILIFPMTSATWGMMFITWIAKLNLFSPSRISLWTFKRLYCVQETT